MLHLRIAEAALTREICLENHGFFAYECFVRNADHLDENPANPPPLFEKSWIGKFCWWCGADAWFARVSLTITVLLIISLAGTIYLPLDQSLAFHDRFVFVIWFISPFINWLILGTIARKTKDLAKKQFRFVVVIFNMVLFVPNFFLGMPRSGLRKQLEWECDGIITDKYVSDNHRALTIVISGKPEVTFEGVTPTFYEVAKVGDIIVKKPWNDFSELNGIRHTIVYRWQSWPPRHDP